MILYFFYLLLSTGKECSIFDPPQNGALACNKIGVDYVCAAMCQNDFDFTFNPPLLYFCSSGQWNFYGLPSFPYSTQLPWPNCTSKFVDKRTDLTFPGYFKTLWIDKRGSMNKKRLSNEKGEIHVIRSCTRVQNPKSVKSLRVSRSPENE